MAGINKILQISTKNIGFNITKWAKPQSLEGLKYAPSLTTDCINLKKTPLMEFKNYMKGVAAEGKDFKPIINDSNSTFAKYYEYVQNHNREQILRGPVKIGNFTVKPTLIDMDLQKYKCFIFENADNLNITKKEYYEIVDEFAKEIQQKISKNPKGLRKEFVDNAAKIHKWAEIFATQTYKDGKNYYSKFYDEKMFNDAINEYTKFVEDLTGKKVLIGCKSRMNFPITALGMLNNPKAYKDVDYIILGHGKNSSLITDTANPNTWRFSDNDKSIWEFIENNIEKGKKALVFCCETDGLRKAGKTAEQMIDKNGNKMNGIGFPVSGYFDNSGPAKIVESGIRHIIGQCNASKRASTTSIGHSSEIFNNTAHFSLKYVEDPVIRYYDLDFNKFKI